MNRAYDPNSPSTTAAPWIRVVIVNYNGRGFLQPCVDALAAQTMPDFEAVIVDNASTDGSVDALCLPDHRFTLARNPSNIGFAAANNIGARHCKCAWIATLNPDTIPSAAWLEEARQGTIAYPDFQMFGATLIDAADGTIVDGFGDCLSITGIPWRGGNGHPVSTLPNSDGEVFAPCAAAAIYDREYFERAGGFDETFFCYVEDVDLGFRMRLLGARCMQLRHAIVHHHGSAITGKTSDFTIFHSFRNRLWMLRKNMPLSLLLLAAPANILYSLLIIALARRSLPAAAALKGLWDGVVKSPGTPSQRRSVRADGLISTGDLLRMLVWNPLALHKRPIQVFAIGHGGDAKW